MKKTILIIFLGLQILFGLISGCRGARIEIDADIVDSGSELLDLLMKETDFYSDVQLSGIGILRQGKEIPLPPGVNITDSASFWIRAQHKENNTHYPLLIGHILYECTTSDECEIDNFNSYDLPQGEKQFAPDLDLPSRNDAFLNCVAYVSGRTRECEVYIDYGNVISVLRFIFDTKDKQALIVLQNVLNETDARIRVIR